MNRNSVLGTLISILIEILLILVLVFVIWGPADGPTALAMPFLRKKRWRKSRAPISR